MTQQVIGNTLKDLSRDFVSTNCLLRKDSALICGYVSFRRELVMGQGLHMRLYDNKRNISQLCVIYRNFIAKQD